MQTVSSERGTGKYIYDVVLIALFAAFALFHLIRTINDAPFHVDEAHKISETYYYHLFFEEHDTTNPAWHRDFYARTNPPVAKYIMGIGLALQGHHVTNHDIQRSFEEYWPKPDVLKKTLSPSLLKSARVISVVFGVLSCLTVYFIGRLSVGGSGRFKGAALGLFAATLLLFHPVLEIFFRQAMTDTIVLFFMTTIFLLSWYNMRLIVTEVKRDGPAMGGRLGGAVLHPLIFAAVLPGINIALAAGTKLVGALAGFFYLFAVLGCVLAVFVSNEWARRGSGGMEKGLDKSKKRFLLLYCVYALLAGALALVIFVAINPYLYDAPIQKIFHLLVIWKDWLVKTMIFPGEPLTLLGQKIAAAGYFQFALSDVTLRLGSYAYYLPVRLIIFLVGLITVAARMFIKTTKGETPVWESLVLLWFVVYAAGVIGWVPVISERYFLPFTPAITVLTAAGAAYILLPIARVFQGKSGSTRLPAGGVFLALALTLVVTPLYNKNLIFNFRSLSPSRLETFSSDRLNALFGDDAASSSDDPITLFNRASFFESREPLWAAVLYRKGLELLKEEELDEPYRIKVVTVRYELARALYISGRPLESASQLSRHILDLKEIFSGFKSMDPYVRGVFWNIIVDRERRLKQIKRTIGDQPPQIGPAGSFNSF